MMPKDLILVRHAESEGNLANKLSRAGDHSAFTPEFSQRHSSKWRLTDKGIYQAKSAGEWLASYFPFTFERQYTSEYLRAVETAMYLGLGGEWYLDFNLRERDQGVMDVLPDNERQSRYAEELRRREIDSFFWAPAGGESLAQACLRIDRVLTTLHRECSNKRVIIVNHGEIMWAFRVRLERMTQIRFHELDASEDPLDHIHNCQILHYTRINPFTGEEARYMNWMRSICPWDTTLSSNDWQEIIRPRFTDADLRTLVESTPRLIQ
ncbi:MAG: histidine phosphatase family protein [Patescibacteria group bacterium]